MAGVLPVAKLTRTAVAALLGASLVAGGAVAADAESGPGRTLTVGVPSGPSVVVGFDRDLFAALAQEVGAGLAWREVSPGTALSSLDAGRFDVAAGPVAPPEAGGRRLLPPVVTFGDAALKRRGDGAVLKPADLAGKVIGSLRFPPEPARLRVVAASFRARAAVRPGFAAGDAAADLAAGRLAALVGPLPDVAAAALARPDAFAVVGPPFGATARLGPVMRASAESTALAEALGAALGRLRADGRLAALQRKWFGLVFDPPDPVSPAARGSPVGASGPPTLPATSEAVGRRPP